MELDHDHITCNIMQMIFCALPCDAISLGLSNWVAKLRYSKLISSVLGQA